MNDSAARVSVTRTYLELFPAAAPSSFAVNGVSLERLCVEDGTRYLSLYRDVGAPHRWTDRADWTEARAAEHLVRTDVSVFALREGEDAGFFELVTGADGSVEIAYLGLVPAYVGRGLGRALLEAAIAEAHRAGPSRVWLHTCTLDHAAALPNYLARGFRPFREETYQVEAI